MKYLILIFLSFVSAFFVAADSAEQEDYQLIRYLLTDKVYDTASIEAKAFLQKYAQSRHKAEVQYLLGRILMEQGKNTEAEAALSQVKTNYQNSPYQEQASYYLGILFKNSTRFDMARSEFKWLIENYSQTEYKENTLYFLMQLAFTAEAWEELVIYEEELTLPSVFTPKQHSEILYMTAWTAHYTGKKEKAKKLFNQLFEDPFLNFQQRAGVLFQLGRYELEQNRKRYALDYFEQLIREHPEDPLVASAVFWQGNIIFELAKEKQGSKALIKLGIQAHTKNLELATPVEGDTSYYQRAWLYFYDEQYEIALEELQQLQTRNEKYRDDREVSLLMAYLQEISQDYDAANETLKLALLMNSDDQVGENKIHAALLTNYVILQDCMAVNKILKKFESYEFLKERQGEILAFHGECLFGEEKYEQASQAYAQVPFKSRYGFVVFEHYVYALTATKQYKALITLIDRVKGQKRYPKEAELLKLKIDILPQISHYTATNKSIERLFKLDKKTTGDYRYYFIQAEMYVKLKDFKNAEIAYWKAFRAAPRKEAAVKRQIGDTLIKFYEKQGNKRRMADAYENSVPFIPAGKNRDQILIYLGNLWDELKKPKMAEQSFSKLHLAGNKNENFEASLLLAELQLRQNKIKSASKTLVDAAAQVSVKSSWYLKIHHRLAQVFHSQELWKKALQHYEISGKAKKASPQKTEALKQIKSIREYLKTVKKGN